MAILRNQPRPAKRVIDLSGPEGNAFVLLGIAKTAMNQLGESPEYIATVLDEMRSGDYENLLTVFDRELGAYFDLVKDWEY